MFHIAYFSEDDGLIAGQIEHVQGQLEADDPNIF